MIILIKISKMITLKTPYWSSWLWCMKICVCVIPKSDQLAAQVVQATSADRAHRRQSGFDQSQFSWWLAIRPITSRLIGATCGNNPETMVQSALLYLFCYSVCICPVCICPIVLGLADRIKNDPAKDVFSHRRLLLGERERKTADIGKRPKPEDFVLLCFRRPT